MLQRLRAAVQAFRAQGGKAITTTVLTDYGPGTPFALGLPLNRFTDHETYLAAMCKKVWVLWKCGDIKSNVAAETPFRFVKKDRAGKTSEVELPELRDLLENPSESETWNDLIYRTFMHLCATGNAFWAKDQSNMRGRPKRLFSLNPKRVSVMIDPINGVAGYIYRPAYGQDAADWRSIVPFAKEEIIHFHVPNPDNDFWGLGEVESAEPLFNSFINHDTWEQGYWSRGATPTTLLVCKTTVPGGAAEFAKMKEKWEKDYGGVSNAGKTAWLVGEWSKEQMGLSLQDMQNIESRRWNCEQVAHQCGVPLSMLGLQGAANYATAKVDDVRFRRDTMKPRLKAVARRLTNDLVSAFDPTAEMEFSLSGLANVEEIAAGYAPWFDRGVLSVNEVRNLLELAELDEPTADQRYMSAGLVPAELSGVAQQQGAVDAGEDIVQRFINGGARPTNGRPKPEMEPEE